MSSTEPATKTSRLLPAGHAVRLPGIAASAGVFSAALLAFLAVGAALPVLPTYVKGSLHGGDLAVRRGSALGAFTAFFDIGVGLGAPIVGATAALAGYPAAFLLAAAAALCTAALAATRGRGR